MNISLNFKKLTGKGSLFYLIGFLITSTELIFHFFGRTLCLTEGCSIVESFVKGGNIVLLVSGVILFIALFFISLKETHSKNLTLSYIHSLILVIALSAEGYLTGFQFFIIKEFCIFCLTVFSVLFIACVIRLMQSKKELIFAFVSFASVFFLTYLVNPQIGTIPSSKYVLVYSKDCPHCREVIQFCKQHSISVEAVEAQKISSTLKSLNINSVPVLFCNEGKEKKFIVGTDNIKEYLLVKAPSTSNQEGTCPIFKPEECK